MSARFAVAVCLLSGLAWGAPAARYNDPAPPVARTPLVARIEEAARAAAQREGRGQLVVDTRLEAAMAQLMGALPKTGAPSNQLVADALHLQGIVEPSPLLLTFGVIEGAEAELTDAIARQLHDGLQQGRYRRVGAAIAETAPGQLRAVLALQESFVELKPVPRQLAPGGVAAIEARVQPPYAKPQLLVTAPDGSVARGVLSARAGWVRGDLACRVAGRYQVELVGEDRFGPTVLANFPVYCGVAAPQSLAASAPAGVPADPPWRDGPEAERQLARLIDGDRARAGLRPLPIDRQLSEAARAHSEDMRDHRFFGHISPTTGAADDRLRRRGIRVTQVMENVGHAPSPAEVERALMDSPGHRANILAESVERMGVGVAVDGAADGRELYATQLFARYPAPFRADAAPEELRARVDGIRRGVGRGLPPLAEDRDLDALAAEVARGLADGTLDPESPDGPVQKGLPKLGGRYKWLKTVIARADEVAQLGAPGGASALTDPRVTHAGVAVREAKPPGGPRADPDPRRLWLVLVLGERR